MNGVDRGGHLDLPEPEKIEPQNRELIEALSLVFGITFGLLVLESVAPFLGSYSQGILALTLVLVPGFVLRKSTKTPEELGTQMGPWRKTGTYTLLTCLVMTMLFLPGFHLYKSEIQGTQLSISWEQLSRWDDDIRAMPANPCRRADNEKAVFAWLDGKPGRLWVVGPSSSSISVSLTPKPEQAREVRCQDGQITASGVLKPRGDWIRSGRDVRGLMVRIGDQASLQGIIKLNGKAIDSNTLRTGRFAQHSDTIDAERSHWWLVFMLAIQLILVAFPEEYFFRGYLQGRLDERFAPKWRILGAQLGPGWILASLAFALLHPILIPGVHRLLVFFPSLHFGWLRARTGSIGAAVLVHAFSNILLAVAGQMYVA